MLRRTTSVTTLCSRFYATTQQQPKVLITGCLGQIGSELVEIMRKKYGQQNVVATDVRVPHKEFLDQVDVNDQDRLNSLVEREKITWMIHNAAFLSATAEKNLKAALKLNCDGLHNVLDTALHYKMRVLIPSSIAAFGPSTPLDNTPDLTIQRPTSVYGIGKLYVELLGEYYNLKKGVDFRSLRYPGIISYKTLPGGGTTDYAVDIFYYALRGQSYQCYLDANENLPMMYMPDCIKSTVDLMEASNEKLKQRVYNVTAFSFTPAQITKAIQKYIPSFNVTYKIDPLRQSLAASWPNSLNDSNARKEWNWQPSYDLDAMVRDMLINLSKKITPNVEIKGLKL